MHLFSTDLPAGGERPARGWIMEVLVVVGILAFGYFAIMLESTPRPAVEVEQATH